MHSVLKDVLRRTLASDQLLDERARMRARFSPPLSYGRHFGPPSPSARPAAVMILLEPIDGIWTIPLTVRPNHLPDHPGQISLPGGRVEGNETHRAAAEREFAEEMGVSPFPGDIIGELQPIYVYNSDYYVRPFVAVCEQPLHYVPCPDEVERVIHLPLSKLTDCRHHVESVFSRGQITWRSLSIQHANDQVWGATAIMLGELAAILANGRYAFMRS